MVFDRSTTRDLLQNRFETGEVLGHGCTEIDGLAFDEDVTTAQVHFTCGSVLHALI